MRIIEKRNYGAVFFFLALAIFIAFAIFTINGNDGILRLMKLKKIKAKLVEENNQVMAENLSFRQSIKSLSDAATIERTAHESLGFVHDNETIFIIKGDQ